MQEVQTYAQQIALVLAGLTIGWTALFSFVAAPVAFKNMIYGRADRYVRQVIRAGHGSLGMVCFAAAAAALLAGAIGAAVVAALTGAFYWMCRWTLAPRTDKRAPGARRQMKGQRVVASWLTALGMPLMLAAAVLIQLRI